MYSDQSNDILIRRVANYSATESMYRITLFKRLESTDDLLTHKEIVALIKGQQARLEKIDNLRFKIFVKKQVEDVKTSPSVPAKLS
jgi:hypothetical protein